MSVEIYFVLDREVPDLTDGVDVAGVVDCPTLEAVATRLGVRPLLTFLSEDPVEAAQLAEEYDLPVPPGGFPREEWFDPADALATVDALMIEVEDHPEAILDAFKTIEPSQDLRHAPDSDEILNDLEILEEILTELVAAEVRFHFAGVA